MNRLLVKCVILIIFGLVSANSAYSESYWEKVKREAAKQYEKVEEATKKTIDNVVNSDKETEAQKSENTKTASSDLNQDKNSVTIAQTNLKKLGLYEGIADGIHGGNTRRAITKFENIEGMARTGDVTQNLLTKLESAVSQGRFYGTVSNPEVVQDNTKPSQQKTPTASSKSSTQNSACSIDMGNWECMQHKVNTSRQTGNNEKAQSTGEQIKTTPQTPKVTTTQKNNNQKSQSDVSQDSKSTTIGVEKKCAMTKLALQDRKRIYAKYCADYVAGDRNRACEHNAKKLRSCGIDPASIVAEEKNAVKNDFDPNTLYGASVGMSYVDAINALQAIGFISWGCGANSQNLVQEKESIYTSVSLVYPRGGSKRLGKCTDDGSVITRIDVWYRNQEGLTESTNNIIARTNQSFGMEGSCKNIAGTTATCVWNSPPNKPLIEMASLAVKAGEIYYLEDGGNKLQSVKVTAAKPVQNNKAHWWEQELAQAKKEGLGKSYATTGSFKQLSADDQNRISEEASEVYDNCANKQHYSNLYDCRCTTEKFVEARMNPEGPPPEPNCTPANNDCDGHGCDPTHKVGSINAEL